VTEEEARLQKRDRTIQSQLKLGVRDTGELFGEIIDKKPMRLVSIRTVDDLALLTYETVRAT
jgi:hypothetical protein